MGRLPTVLATFCVLFLSTALSAATPRPTPPGQTPDVLAKELTELTRADTLPDRIIRQLLQVVGTGLRRANPGRETEVNEILSTVFLPEIRKGLPDLITRQQRAYIDTFTLAELKDLVAFYKSPLGRKWMENSPLVARQRIRVGQDWAQELLPEAQKKVLDAVKAKGLAPA